MDLASWQEERGDCRGVVWVTADWGGGRKINNGVDVYSWSRLIEPNLISQACLMNGSDMSDSLRL
jgi:hypothetical protein